MEREERSVFREWFENGGNSFRLDIRIDRSWNRDRSSRYSARREIMFLRDAFFCFVSNHGEIRRFPRFHARTDPEMETSMVTIRGKKDRKGGISEFLFLSKRKAG